MEQQTKTIITFAVLVVVLFGLYFFTDWFSKTTGYALGEDQKATLAQCITSMHGEFYQTSNCPDCEDQLEIFGDSARFLNIITCATREECPAGGVPAWRINAQTHYGVKQLDELIAISGCSVEN